jgi:hypothetical protein
MLFHKCGPGKRKAGHIVAITMPQVGRRNCLRNATPAIRQIPFTQSAVTSV